jgi:hypothetical protein
MRDSGQADTFEVFLQKAKCLRGPTLQETEGEAMAEEQESSSEHLSFAAFADNDGEGNTIAKERR